MRKFLKITLFTFAFLFIFLTVLGFLLPYLVNLSAVKTRISRKLSETLRAEVSVRTLRLKVFFRPALSAEEVKIRTPHYLLTVESLRFYPDLLALCQKKVVIEDFGLISPHFTLFLSEEPSEKAWRLEEVLKDLPVLPSMELVISEGRLEVFQGKVFLFALEDLSATLNMNPEQILLEGKGQASFLKKFRLKSRWDLRRKASEGLIELTGVDLSGLKPLFRGLPLFPAPTDFSLSLTYAYEEGILVGGFKGSASRIRFPETPHLPFVGAGFEGEFSYGNKGFFLTLKDLKCKEPRFSGEIYFRRDQESYYFKALLEELDFTALRARLGALFPENKELRKFLNLVPAGTFSDLDLKTRAKTVEGLFRVENLILSARVKGAKLDLPHPPLNFFETSGILTLVRGDLDFKGSGKLPAVNVSEASVKIHLKDLKAPLEIRAEFSGDAEALLNIAGKVSSKVAKALRPMSFKGLVSGEIILAGTRAKPRISLELCPQGMIFSHAFWPSPFKVSGGRILYQQGRLVLSGIELSGKLGSFQEISVSLFLESKPYEVKVDAFRGRLQYSELQKILLRYPEVKGFLEKYRPQIETLEIESLWYQGPLKGENLKKDLIVKVVVPSGDFFVPLLKDRIGVKKLPAVYSEGKLSFGPGEIRIYSSNFTVSGEVDPGSKVLSLRGSGQASRALLEFLYRKVSLPEGYLLKTPLEVRDFSAVFSPSNLLFSGDFKTAGEATLAFSLERRPSFLKISSGRILFRKSTLLFSGEKFPDYYLFAFKGEVFSEMISALIEKNPGFKGYLKGDLEVYFHRKHPLMSRFKGRLEGGNLVLPLKGQPYIKSFRGHGRERTLFLEELELSLAGSDFSASGQLEVASKSLRFEGHVRSKWLDLPRLKSLYSGDGPKKFKVLGHLDLILDEVRINANYKLQKVRAGLFVSPQKTTLVLSEAQFCSLPLKGKIVRAKKNSLDLLIYQPKGEFKNLWSCLSKSGRTLISGPFSLKAELYLRGRKSLFETGSGHLTLNSPSGVIYRFSLLAKIFGFLSPIDLFQGKHPLLEKKKGLSYEKLGLQGRIFGNRFRVDKAFMDAPGLRLFASGDIFLPKGELDLTVLVSPLKTLDVITSKLPIIGFVLTGKEKMLISVPIKVKGTYRNPSIIPLHPEAIGEEILRLFKRVFELPAEVKAQILNIIN